GNEYELLPLHTATPTWRQASTRRHVVRRTRSRRQALRAVRTCSGSVACLVVGPDGARRPVQRERTCTIESQNGRTDLPKQPGVRRDDDNPCNFDRVRNPG